LALQDVARLRLAGFPVSYSYKAAAGIGKQFKEAGQSDCAFVLVYGSDELAAGKVKVKRLAGGEEFLLDRSRIEELWS
jgi:histidyl-tRNA synthetase